MSMTVADLKRALAPFPDDTIVVMSEDGEGNGFSPLSEAAVALYDAETTYSGETYPLTPGDDDEPAPESAVGCVLLWPVN